jgi:hypothetical protein
MYSISIILNQGSQTYIFLFYFCKMKVLAINIFYCASTHTIRNKQKRKWGMKKGIPFKNLHKPPRKLNDYHEGFVIRKDSIIYSKFMYYYKLYNIISKEV